MTNIELPRDAKGREIPLDTKVLYDKDNYAFLGEIINFTVGGRCLDDEGDINERLILNRLADLINPTCFDTESNDSKSFTCSACGFSESKLALNPFTLSFFWVKPSYCYCHMCGAEVIDD